MRKWCAEHMASLHVKRFYDSWLEKEALCNLLKKGDITAAEYRAAVETDPRQTISVHLPYSQVYL